MLACIDLSFTPVEDARRPPVDPEELKELLGFLSSSDDQIIASVLECFGDLGRRGTFEGHPILFVRE